MSWLRLWVRRVWSWLPDLFADVCAAVAAVVSMGVVSLGTNPYGVCLAVVLCAVSVLWLVRPRGAQL